MKRKSILAVVTLACIILLSLLPREETSPTPPLSTGETGTSMPEVGSSPSMLPLQENTYPVARVVDGDTVIVRMDGANVTLRLIGLDTPETVDPRKPVQCFGKEASAKAKEVLAGKTVRLEMDASQGTYDKYHRTLAYVFLADPSTPLGASGISFNEFMIAEGYGHEYTYDLPYKYQKEFKAAEQRAREEKKGLWADGVCG